MRSLLIVRADQAAALPTALAARPGAIVFDLDDPRTGDRATARRQIARLLAETAAVPDRPRLLVRIAALSSGLVDDDLGVIAGAGPDAVVAPGIVGARDIEHLGAKLAVREAMLGVRPGATGIVAVAGDTAAGILALGTLRQAGPRLEALGFDGTAFGAPDAAPARTARGSLVLAAMAAGVAALDLGREPAAHLDEACAASRRDGFAGRFTRDPAEVATIEACLDGRRRPDLWAASVRHAAVRGGT